MSICNESAIAIEAELKFGTIIELGSHESGDTVLAIKRAHPADDTRPYMTIRANVRDGVVAFHHGYYDLTREGMSYSFGERTVADDIAAHEDAIVEAVSERRPHTHLAHSGLCAGTTYNQPVMPSTESLIAAVEAGECIGRASIVPGYLFRGAVPEFDAWRAGRELSKAERAVFIGAFLDAVGPSVTTDYHGYVMQGEITW